MKLPKGVSLLEGAKLEFLNFDSVLHAGKRNRKHRVWGYISIIYSDSMDLLFLKNGEPFNAARLTPKSRKILPIKDVVERAKETKLGIVSVYSVDEELIHMILATITSRPIKADIDADKIKIGLLLKKLSERKFNGFLHLKRGLEESFISYKQGIIGGAYLAGSHDKLRDEHRIIDLFSSIPNLKIDLYEEEVAEEQAPPAMIEMFYSIFTRIFQSLGKAMGESLVVKTAIKGRAAIQKDYPFLENVKINPDLSLSGDIMVSSEELVKAFAHWLNTLIETFTTFLGDEVIRIAKDALADYRFVLKSAGFFKTARIKMD
ncbi:hypothetical protein DRP53_04585 [candidate division WOR-3 bacterium]|uniref:DUF4388 domain-containing protein n=1 Tax=candidate division WOR-3 bacterium TaxID=2052148 RepID=A0A660SKK9_UNCW3|nr:MAG: hypothetical protein DRP53_04585 [candidate division WOR-3 bacterium]